MTRLLCGMLLAAATFAQTPISVPQADAAQAKGRKNGLFAVIATSMGDITIQLFEKESPATVASFVGLSMGTKPWTDPATKAVKTTPLYNGTIFHRVIPSFMIQGGDPTGTGGGSVGFVVPDEWTRSGLTFNIPGRVAMANAGPNTTGCQFFITTDPASSLDEKHTIFGQVLDGMKVVQKIAGVPRDANDRPRTPVTIQTVQIFRVGPEPQVKVKK
jgi:peptidyl-prolyl cis-trans isomerase A (cyclophilin A)